MKKKRGGGGGGIHPIPEYWIRRLTFSDKGKNMEDLRASLYSWKLERSGQIGRWSGKTENY